MHYAHRASITLCNYVTQIAFSAAVASSALGIAAAEERVLPVVSTTSTIPSNGDVNPYGIAFVPPEASRWTSGTLKPGDLLVSNFNASSNMQGTGTTIVSYRPSDKVFGPNNAQLFFQETPGQQPGLTLALGILKRGAIIVGVLSTTDGTSATAQGGPLLVIDPSGKLVQTIAPGAANKINGPWGLAIADRYTTAALFVSNVFDGTVTRLDVTTNPSANLSNIHATTIASGYHFRPDPAALEIGPAGLAYDEKTDTLYVASEVDNAIFKVPNAVTRTSAINRGVLFATAGNLRGPVGLALAPNGHVVASNSDAVNGDVNHPSEILEFSRDGRFISEYNVNESQGAAFGVAFQEPRHNGHDGYDRTFGRGLFAAVNDVSNNLSVRPLDDK